MNPANYHPLREILDEQIDFEELRRSSAVKLFVCASNIMTNRLRVFERQDICADAMLASACLPHVFQAIEIEGQHYWDGGYMGKIFANFPISLPTRITSRSVRKPTYCAPNRTSPPGVV